VNDKSSVPAWALLLAGWLSGVAVRPVARADEPRIALCSATEQSLPRLGPSPRAWRQLSGVGSKRALAAARAHWEHDPRRGALDWVDVPGIGPVTALRLESLVGR